MSAPGPQRVPVPAQAWLIGADIGGSGSRLCAMRADGSGRRLLEGPRVNVGASGSDAGQTLQQLIDAARHRWPQVLSQVVGLGIGTSGLASLVQRPQQLVQAASAEMRAPAAAAVDAVTAHLGALGGAGGAAAVLGTGAVAVGHPGPDAAGRWGAHWRRADGWGHLLGDRGSGAWVGRRALELALQAHDGVDAEGAQLLQAAVRRFGDVGQWPGLFYTREDRAGLLAEFTHDVVSLAEADSAPARGLLEQAGTQAARSALAALPADAPQRMAVAGGLAAAHNLVRSGFAAEISRLSPQVHLVTSADSPVGGAVELARLAAEGTIVAQEKILWL